jgi:hypothetical protein
MSEQNRKMAAGFFNAVWALLDKPGRSSDEDLQMVLLAHASRAHWQVVRSCWVAGDLVGATQHESQARAIAADLTDREERDLLLADLNGGR